jgi:type VII secretion-associated protein (TIGR03931 family)
MTRADAVVIVGPADVVAARTVDADLVAAAFESIDDAVALLDDRNVPSDVVWREVMAAAVGPGAGTAVLVCPSWWQPPRIDVVCAAARQLVGNVTVLRRADVLRGGDSTAIIEIGEDFVVVHVLGEPPAVVPCVGDPRAVIDAIVARIDASDAVIDVPLGIAGATRLADEVARTLRTRGIKVSVADDRRVLRAAEGGRAIRHRGANRSPLRPRRPGGPLTRLVQPRAAALAGAGLVVVALACGAAGYGADDSLAATAWLVEGRVAVEVPADWTTERIVSGPGSARVQVLSPWEPHVAIHVTQSPGQGSLAAAAEALRAALGAQPDGVFVEFTPADRRADRAVISYREIRADHHVDWTVMLDGGVRIAIGCQHAPDGPTPRRVCDQAIRSARTLG